VLVADWRICNALCFVLPFDVVMWYRCRACIRACDNVWHGHEHIDAEDKPVVAMVAVDASEQSEFCLSVSLTPCYLRPSTPRPKISYAYDEPFIAGTRAASGLPARPSFVMQQWREIRGSALSAPRAVFTNDVQNYDQIETSCYWSTSWRSVSLSWRCSDFILLKKLMVTAPVIKPFYI